jgi:hypothetical protein
MRHKEIEVLLGSLISMIAVDPQKANVAFPCRCEVLRVAPMRFDKICHARRGQVCQEVWVARISPAQIGISR